MAAPTSEPRRVKKIRLSSFAVLAVVALSLGCGGERHEGPRRVFLITVDTLRADHLGAYGYVRDTSPRIDALARQGVVFERAFAQWPKTGTSFASIFTGQYPQTTGLTHKAATTIPEGYLTLPQFFDEEGYRTLAVVSNAVLSAELGWNRGFDSYVESWDDPRFSDDPDSYRELMYSGRVNELAMALLEQHADAEKLYFWVHYSDPHAPYVLQPGDENPFLGDEFFAPGRSIDLTNTRGKRVGDEDDLAFYIAQYDANVRVTDRAIGQFVDRLAELGLLEDALIVVSADHGEALGEHDLFFEHGPLPYNDGSHVPLIFWGEGVEAGKRVSAAVEMIDVYPTLVELLEPEQDVPGLEGTSLLPWLRGVEGVPGESAHAFTQAGGQRPLRHYRSIQDGRFKLIYHPAIESARTEREAWWEFYDLEEDPGETRNLFPEGGDDLRRLQRLLSERMADGDWMRRSSETIEERSQETLKALRALGYLQ